MIGRVAVSLCEVELFHLSPLQKLRNHENPHGMIFSWCFNIQWLYQILAPIPVSGDVIKYPPLLSTAACSLPVSALSSWLEAGWEEGVLHTSRPPPPLPAKRPRPVPPKSSFTVKTRRVVCIIYFLLFMSTFFFSNERWSCVCLWRSDEFILSSFSNNVV